jgi:Cytochrome c554 and c-prime
MNMNDFAIMLWGRRRYLGICLGAICALIIATRGQEGPVPSTPQVNRSSSGYVGSKACAQCHQSIYDSYSKTDMARSMSTITPFRLERIPTSASVFDARSQRHFETYVHDNELSQAEFATALDGKEIFRDTHKVEWIIGSGANGFGAIVRRENYLFEAPLSFYTKTNGWALSPGYEFADYGFSRPVLAGCIVCHSGRPQPVADGDGLFRDPPFEELAIGCENCHGPGETHIVEMQLDPSQGAGHSIVNPAKLTPWLADNICMSCHQAGDARIFKPGKDYSQFRPGSALEGTLSILMVPLRRESTPRDDLLQHYLSMLLSKCYRGSRGRLACIGCHDPHVEPSAQEAPAYFRQKCLACHTEKSCALPLAIRQRKVPADDCAGCHMPKRDVKVISHSVLTNHRIVAQAEEPFPDAAFHMTTTSLPDLVHLNVPPGRDDSTLDPLTLLQAYGQIALSHPEYRERYWALGKQLQTVEPDNLFVLEALADAALQQKTPEGTGAAIGYLDRATIAENRNAADFEQLANLLIATGRVQEAIAKLQRGINLIPYDAELYRLLGKSYLSQNQTAEALPILKRATEIFPGDEVIRKLLKECESTKTSAPAP